MSGGAYYGNGKRISARSIIKYAVLVLSVCILSCMQTSFFKLFGSPVGLAFLFVLATGFLFSEREGAIIGTVGGVIIDSLGGGVIYLSPLVYMLIGYFCGFLSKKFLSRNLPSFLVYALMAELIKQVVNLLYFVMLSDNFNLMQIFMYSIVPDYISTVLLSPALYGAVLGLYKLINIQRKKKL